MKTQIFKFPESEYCITCEWANKYPGAPFLYQILGESDTPVPYLSLNLPNDMKHGGLMRYLKWAFSCLITRHPPTEDSVLLAGWIACILWRREPDLFWLFGNAFQDMGTKIIPFGQIEEVDE